MFMIWSFCMGALHFSGYRTLLYTRAVPPEHGPKREACLGVSKDFEGGTIAHIPDQPGSPALDRTLRYYPQLVLPDRFVDQLHTDLTVLSSLRQLETKIAE